MLDRERCIICARCTRFGDLVAGDHALEFIERGYKTEVGTPGGGPAESKFIGNTIMICPVGALTSQVYRFRARPWDNESTDSTCTLCPVGCSMILDSRDGEIMRTRSCENRDVNDIWLCDKGWFGYEFTYHPDRLQHPLIRRNGSLQKATWEEALSLIAEKIQQFKPEGKLGALGGNPLTVEENYLFQKLMRDGAGVNHVDHRVGMPILSLDEEGVGPGMEMSIGECEQLSFALLLGVDLTEEFPVIWLRLKQAINRGAKVIFLGHYAPEIAPHLAETILHPPGQEIEVLRKHLPSLLAKEQKGALFLGRQYLATTQRRAILSEVSKLAPNLSLNLLEGKGNSTGARFAGMHPQLGPFNQPLDKPGLNVLQMLETAAHSGWDLLYVAGADPATHTSSKQWKEVRANLKFLIVQDLFLTETARQADVVLPTLSYVEKGGSFMNIEHRIQKLLPGKEIPPNIYSDAEIFIKLAALLGIQNLGSGIHNLGSGIQNPESRIQNPKSRIQNPESRIQNFEKSLRAEEELLTTFATVLFDRGERMKHNPHVAQLTKEPYARIHPREGLKKGIEDGQKIMIGTDQNTIEAKISWDDGVAENTLVLPLGFEQISVYELAPNLLSGLKVKVWK